MKFDLVSQVNVAASLLPASRSASGTGDAVDLRGFESAFAVAQVGAMAGGTVTPSLEASYDGTSYAAVGTADLLGTFSAITAGTAVQRVGYSGTGRYLKGVFTQAGGTMTSAIAIVRGHPHRSPLA